MRQRGFTLVELLVVISIIAVLAAVLFPLFARAREHARLATCASNLAQVGAALNLYAQNYDGRYPPKNNEFGPLYEYMKNLDVFYCPSDSAERYWEMKQVTRGPQDSISSTAMVPVRTYSSYVYKGGLTNDDRADTPIASEAQIWHRHAANVLYLGGHVRSVPAESYKPVVEPTQKPVEKEPVPGAKSLPGAPIPSGPPMPN